MVRIWSPRIKSNKNFISFLFTTVVRNWIYRISVILSFGWVISKMIFETQLFFVKHKTLQFSLRLLSQFVHSLSLFFVPLSQSTFSLLSHSTPLFHAVPQSIFSIQFLILIFLYFLTSVFLCIFICDSLSLSLSTFPFIISLFSFYLYGFFDDVRKRKNSV